MPFIEQEVVDICLQLINKIEEKAIEKRKRDQLFAAKKSKEQLELEILELEKEKEQLEKEKERLEKEKERLEKEKTDNELNKKEKTDNELNQIKTENKSLKITNITTLIASNVKNINEIRVKIKELATTIEQQDDDIESDKDNFVHRDLLDWTSARPSKQLKPPFFNMLSLYDSESSQGDYPKPSKRLISVIKDNLKLYARLDIIEDKQVVISHSVFTILGKLYKSIKDNSQDAENIALFMAPCFGHYLGHAMERGMNIAIVDFGKNEEESLANLSKFLEKSVNKVKTFTINNPNNPDGRVMSKEYLQALAHILKKYPNITIICDDIFHEVILDETSRESYNHFYQTVSDLVKDTDSDKDKQDLEDLKNRIVILDGCSKMGKAGIRVSYAYIPNGVVKDKAVDMMDSCPTEHSQAIAAHFLDTTNEQVKDFLNNQRENYNQVLDEMEKYMQRINKALNTEFKTKNIKYIKFYGGGRPKAANMCIFDFSALKSCSYISDFSGDKSKKETIILNSGYDIAKLLYEKCGIGVVPGELFSIDPEKMLVRSNLAMTKDELASGFNRIEDTLLHIARNRQVSAASTAPSTTIHPDRISGGIDVLNTGL